MNIDTTNAPNTTETAIGFIPCYRGDLILDTHLGSASIAIACHREKFSLVGCELIEEYYLAGLKRLENEQMQTTLF